jgi:hypothetical protein
MNDIFTDVISSINLNTNKRDTKGRDKSKNYHKITISVDQYTKLKVNEYAKNNDISVSKLIKDLLQEKGII